MRRGLPKGGAGNLQRFILLLILYGFETEIADGGESRRGRPMCLPSERADTQVRPYTNRFPTGIVGFFFNAANGLLKGSGDGICGAVKTGSSPTGAGMPYFS